MQKKRILALLLAAMMICTMAGCQSENGGEEPPKVETGESVATPVPESTETPSSEVVADPTAPVQSEKPADKPAAKPAAKPADTPEGKPVQKPAEAPEAAPAPKPAEKPVVVPTPKPAEKPDAAPTQKPTEKPTAAPTQKPTAAPSEAPTAKPQEAKTVGQILLADFKAKAGSAEGAEELANALSSNSILPFFGATMPVEPGLLSGFGNTEIKGFREGAMFAPMIGAIPFVGYVFVLEDGVSAGDFVATLKKSADLRWNICVEAEEMVTGTVGNKVFFVMCPKDFSEE